MLTGKVGPLYGIAARIMRRVLVDEARRRRATKREGFGGERVTLSDVAARAAGKEVDVLALHEALTHLAAMDQRQSRVVELRYFGVLTTEEIATAVRDLGSDREARTHDCNDMATTRDVKQWIERAGERA